MADLGAQGDGGGIGDEIGLGAPIRGDAGCHDAGGTGVRYLSLGLRVNAGVSEWLRQCFSVGISSTLRRWPGRRGHIVVDGSVGSWHSSSSSTLYCIVLLGEA